MRLTFLLILVLILAAVAAVASGWGETMAEAPHDRLPWRLPEGPLAADSLATLTFSPALRGYRCDEVDAVIARLVSELADRDDRLAQLDGRPGAPSLVKRPTELERPTEGERPTEPAHTSGPAGDAPVVDEG